MALTIHKYKLGEFAGQMSKPLADKEKLPKFISMKVEMPTVAKLMHFEIDINNTAWLWALVYDGSTKSTHRFVVYPTGFLIHDFSEKELAYVGTCQRDPWPWVWHMFEINE